MIRLEALVELKFELKFRNSNFSIFSSLKVDRHFHVGKTSPSNNSMQWCFSQQYPHPPLESTESLRALEHGSGSRAPSPSR